METSRLTSGFTSFESEIDLKKYSIHKLCRNLLVEFEDTAH